MKLNRSLVLIAGVTLTSSSAFAQTAPHAQASPAAGVTGGATTGAPAVAPAAGAAGATGDPTKPAEPAPPEGDDMEMTFHATRPADMQQFATGSLTELRIGTAKARYALNLFGDLSLGAASRSEGGTKPDAAFAVGVFDMLFSADLGSKIEATAELTAEYEPGAPLTELERLHMRWHPSKAFFVEVGRFHTDIGYWNVAYHHGKWLQLPIERPRIILLHGGLLPVHWIGIQSGLSASVGKGSINLVGSIGSARDPIGTSGHAAHGTAFTPVNGGHIKLESAGIGLPDLHVGVSGIYDRVPGEAAFTRPALPDYGIDELVGNVYIAYPSVPLIFIAEAYEIQHSIPKGDLLSGEAGAKWRTYGAFGMVGYAFGRVTPYLKGEYTKSKAGADIPDPFFIPEPLSSHPPEVALNILEGTAGMRIDTSTWSSLKIEYRATAGQALRLPNDTHPLIHTGTINWSFGI